MQQRCIAERLTVHSPCSPYYGLPVPRTESVNSLPESSGTIPGLQVLHPSYLGTPSQDHFMIPLHVGLGRHTCDPTPSQTL